MCEATQINFCFLCTAQFADIHILFLTILEPYILWGMDWFFPPHIIQHSKPKAAMFLDKCQTNNEQQ